MKNEIYTSHRLVKAGGIAHIPDVELQFGMIQGNAHVFLLLFVTAEDAYFADIGIQKSVKHRIAERSGSTGDHQDFVIKHG